MRRSNTLAVFNPLTWRTGLFANCVHQVGILAFLLQVFYLEHHPSIPAKDFQWQYLRQKVLGNRVFQGYEDLVDHVCQAWRALLDETGRMTSITDRDWARVG